MWFVSISFAITKSHFNCNLFLMWCDVWRVLCNWICNEPHHHTSRIKCALSVVIAQPLPPPCHVLPLPLLPLLLSLLFCPFPLCGFLCPQASPLIDHISLMISSSLPAPTLLLLYSCCCCCYFYCCCCCCCCHCQHLNADFIWLIAWQTLQWLMLMLMRRPFGTYTAPFSWQTPPSPTPFYSFMVPLKETCSLMIRFDTILLNFNFPPFVFMRWKGKIDSHCVSLSVFNASPINRNCSLSCW